MTTRPFGASISRRDRMLVTPNEIGGKEIRVTLNPEVGSIIKFIVDPFRVQEAIGFSFPQILWG